MNEKEIETRLAISGGYSKEEVEAVGSYIPFTVTKIDLGKVFLLIQDVDNHATWLVEEEAIESFLILMDESLQEYRWPGLFIDDGAFIGYVHTTQGPKQSICSREV